MQDKPRQAELFTFAHPDMGWYAQLRTLDGRVMYTSDGYPTQSRAIAQGVSIAARRGIEVVE